MDSEEESNHILINTIPEINLNFNELLLYFETNSLLISSVYTLNNVTHIRVVNLLDYTHIEYVSHLGLMSILTFLYKKYL
mgnify:CR=1 FL=1